jgi:superfamily II DNA or RNA helicase
MQPTEKVFRKAVLSNRIYVQHTPEMYDKCKNELTYKIPSKIPGQPPETITSMKMLGERTLMLPVGRTDLIPKNYTIVDNRVVNPVNFPTFRFDLREDQQVIFDKVEDSCLINANPSWGKTFTGIAIATKLGVKTLVIVHTLALLKQWVKEVKKGLGIEPGLITKGVLKVDAPIVIANIQTLRNHLLKVNKLFGLIIVDEVHHTPATVFEKTLNMFHSRYRIGLSATLRRKDYKHVVITDYFSKTIHVAPKNNQIDPKIIIIDSNIELNSNPMVPWATKVNELVQNPSYFNLVSGLSIRSGEQGHKVLTVSDRTEFIEKLHAKDKEASVMVTGSVGDAEREERHRLITEDPKIRTLYGAISIYKEGISINCLSTLIPATPINNEPLLEQLIGRIERIQEDKLSPIVYDIKLAGATGRRQALARLNYYIDKGYEITVAG